MWELWWVKIVAFPLTWHIAYTTACCYTAQAVNGRAVVIVVVRPSVRLSVVLHGCIVAKRYEIGLRLLLITNRKSHTGFQMT